MTRLQFWILNGMGGLILLLFITHVLVVQKGEASQAKLIQAQQFIREGQLYDSRVRQLASRIYQVGQQTQDQALKDLLTREDFHVNPPASTDTSTPPDSTTAPATSTPTH